MERGRVQLLLREAIASARSGNKAWARECLSRVLRTDPRNEEAWLWLSAVLESSEEKRFCLEKVLTINPNSTQARAGLRYLQQQGQEEAGAPQPKRTICPMCGEPNPPTAFQCANCGQDLFVPCPACTERVDVDRTACPACGLEIGDSSDGAGYFFHLGELYLQKGKSKPALAAWDKTLILEPDYPGVAEVAAEAFLASGQRDLAIQSFQRAVEEATEKEQRRKLRLRLAAVYRELKRPEEAARLYQELQKEDKERREPRADLYAELGRFYQQERDTDQAQQNYEMALALDGSLSDVRFAIAEILLAEGSELRALDEYRSLQQVGGEIGELSAARVRELRPPVPEAFLSRWQETVRGMARYFLAGLLLLFLRLGRSWEYIFPWGFISLLTFLGAGYFLTAAVATPRNLPTFARLARLLETPTGMRLRSWRRRAGQANWLQKFLAWQARSTKSLLARLRVVRTRLSQFLRRAVALLARNWEKLRASRPVRTLKALPQSRTFRALAALSKKPFFLAIGRFFRRIFPRRSGPSPVRRVGQGLRDFRQRLRERAGGEVSELQVYRWMAGILGFLLLVLAGSLILLL